MGTAPHRIAPRRAAHSSVVLVLFGKIAMLYTRQVGTKLKYVQVAGRWIVVRPVAQVEGVVLRRFNTHLEKEVTVLVRLSFAG